MAVTVLERPQGQVLSETGISGIINSTYGTGDATVGSAAHGLSDGDYVYVVSDIEDYNGFWYVDSTGANTFKLLPYMGGTAVQFIQNASITYYVSELTHGWSAVHLPITYRLSSDLYPVNTVNNVRNILSKVNDNGSVLFNISGSLGAIHTYDSVQLIFPNDTEYSGIYTILDWISDTVMTIDLAYDSTINITGATIQKFFNNYNILVRVYAGITSSHEWQSEKPYELASTLQLIPDENGDVFFSINEILKSYVETRNNPLLGTLPNNIDFWTNFYIEYGESYDDSEGYALGTFTSSFTSDQSTFEGVAVNSKLEFKNQYSGYMSEYLMDGSGKLLTLFESPVLFDGIYQDISFIKTLENDYVLRKQYYLNGVSGISEDQTISGDYGIYRVPITGNCEYDRVDITIFYNDESITLQPGSGQAIYTGFAPVIVQNTLVLPGVGQATYTGLVPTIYNGAPL